MECTWSQDGVGEQAWDTSCHNRFLLNDATPRENHMMFCCYCGKALVEDVAVDQEAPHGKEAE